MPDKKNVNIKKPKKAKTQQKASDTTVVKLNHGEIQRLKLLNLGKSSPNRALQSFMNAGSEVSSKETLLKITRYVDYSVSDTATDTIFNHTFEMEQDLLAPDGTNNLGINAVICRVQRCRLSVYPRSANAENALNVFAALTSVPVRAGGGNAELSAHQQSVIVPPTFTPMWHKVFDCDYDKLFSSSQVQPVDSTAFPLFNTQLVNVDTAAPFSLAAIQLKIETWVAQTVPLRSQVQFGQAYQADFVNSTSVPSDRLAFVQVLGMSDRT